MVHRRSSRKFILNKSTGDISIRSTANSAHELSEEDEERSFTAESMLAALIEVEELLSPAFAREHVPASLAIVFLADGIWLRETGEEDGCSLKVRAMLCQFILAVWGTGKFFPSPAFPYTYEEIQAAFTTPPEEQEDTLSDDAVPTALAQIESLSRGELLSPEIVRGIDHVLHGLIIRGLRAMQQKQYKQAAQAFQQATRFDLDQVSEATYQWAMACIWQSDLAEGYRLFAQDQENRAGVAPLSWLFSLWCSLCIASSRAAWLVSCEGGTEDGEDMLALQEDLFDEEYSECDDGLQTLAMALLAYLNGEYAPSLSLFDEFMPDVLDIPLWVVSFWRAMALAELGQYEDAQMALRQSLEEDIPPLFLLPLRWFEHTHRLFYDQVVYPLFSEINLWPGVATSAKLEQETKQARIQRYVEQIEQALPGFAQVRKALDAMRERVRSGIGWADLECRYLVDPPGEDLVEAYVEFLEQQALGDGQALPVFLAEIPPPTASRASTYLVSELLRQIDDPLAFKRDGIMQKQLRLIHRLRERKVELVVLTCIENLTTPAGTKLLLNEIEWLRHLFVNEIGNIPLLLVGNADMIEAIRTANEDFGRLLTPLVNNPKSRSRTTVLWAKKHAPNKIGRG